MDELCFLHLLHSPLYSKCTAKVYRANMSTQSICNKFHIYNDTHYNNSHYHPNRRQDIRH